MTDLPAALEAHVEAVAKAAAEAIGPDAFDCTRVWSAWSYGTMTADDFSEVTERSDEIARAALAVIAQPWAEMEREIARLKASCKSAGLCMTCLLGAPDTFGCTDCLNTGWDGGNPHARAERAEAELAALKNKSESGG